MCLQLKGKNFKIRFWSTWVEIHVCLQRADAILLNEPRSTWVEIHVCLQRVLSIEKMIKGSTWVEIHVCLQL